MEIGSKAKIGDMIVKVEVAVKGDTKEFDVIRNVDHGIRYLDGPELIQNLKSSRGTDVFIMLNLLFGHLPFVI